MDPAKLKVVDLRQELQQRGLDTKGVKAALVKRLKDALEKESAEDVQNDSKDTSTDKIVPEDNIEESAPNTDIKKEIETVKEPEPQEKESNDTPEPMDTKVKIDEKEKQISVQLERMDETLVSESVQTEVENVEEEPDENGECSEKPSEEESPKKTETASVERNGKRKRHDDSFELETRTSKKPREKAQEQAEIAEDEPDVNYEKVQLSWYDSDLNLQVDKNTFAAAKPLTDGCFGFVWAGVRATYGTSKGKVCFEVKITEELDWHDPTMDMVDRKDKDKKHKSDKDHAKKDEVKDSPAKIAESKDEEGEEKCEDETKLEESSQESSQEPAKDENADAKTEPASKPEEISTDEKMEEQQEDGDTESKEGSEQASQDDKDKEKDGEKDSVKESIPEYYLRVGFSIAGSTLQLGETKYSYGYESTGKFVTDKEFREYGVAFGLGDVIGAYLSIDDENLIITYTVNGKVQSAATTIPKSELPSGDLPFALFPHILCRNYAYEVNFGNRESAWFPHPDELKDHLFVQNATDKVAGPRRPEKRNDCEFILMIGLSGSGKTYWVNKYIETNKDQMYTIIGNDSVFQRMTVDGQPFKSRFSGSWRVLVDKLQKCLNTMTDIAALRRRHIIIDQTNVFPQAQNRKLRAFDGFRRKAVCLICSDEELARRQKMRDNDSGKNVPESTLLEQKGQIELPQKFEDVVLIFPDLNEEESKKMIKKYHEEFQQRSHHKRNYNNRRDQRRSYQPNNYRDRGSYARYDRYSQRSWGRPSGGGWGRDRRDNRGPPTPSSRYNNNPGWRPRIDDRSRPHDDHRHSYGGASRNQSGRGQGWSSNDRRSGWGGNQGWNQQLFGSSAYGAWNHQQQGWKYNGGSQGGGGGGGYSGNGSTGNQQSWNWNYGQYGQQQGGWGGGAGGSNSNNHVRNNPGYNNRTEY